MARKSLRPTNNSVRLHILRAFYVVYTQINCLNKKLHQLNQVEYGWKEQDELMLPLYRYKFFCRLPMNLFTTAHVKYVRQNRVFVYHQQYFVAHFVFVIKKEHL